MLLVISGSSPMLLLIGTQRRQLLRRMVGQRLLAKHAGNQQRELGQPAHWARMWVKHWRRAQLSLRVLLLENWFHPRLEVVCILVAVSCTMRQWRAHVVCLMWRMCTVSMLARVGTHPT